MLWLQYAILLAYVDTREKSLNTIKYCIRNDYHCSLKSLWKITIADNFYWILLLRLDRISKCMVVFKIHHEKWLTKPSGSLIALSFYKLLHFACCIVEQFRILSTFTVASVRNDKTTWFETSHIANKYRASVWMKTYSGINFCVNICLKSKQHLIKIRHVFRNFMSNSFNK